MTTTSDPFGTPNITYNKNGANIQVFEITPGNLVSTNIPSGTSYFVVNSTTSASSDGIELPDANIGDILYIFNSNQGFSLNIHAKTGETIFGDPYSQIIAPKDGSVCIKVSDANWVATR